MATPEHEVAPVKPAAQPASAGSASEPENTQITPPSGQSANMAPPSAQTTTAPPPSTAAAATPPATAFAAAGVPAGNTEPNAIKQDPYVDLSALVNVGRIEDTVRIFDYAIRMHTLRADENTEALAAVGHMGDTAGANALMIQVLARAIDSINGVPLEQIYKGNQQSRIAKRVELVQAFQQTFLTRLWEQYTNLMDRSTAIADEAEEPLKNL